MGNAMQWIHPRVAPGKLISSVRKSLKERGVAYAVIRSAQVAIGYYVSFTGWRFDCRYGTDTSGIVETPSEIVSNNALYGTSYVPMSPYLFRRIIRNLPHRRFADFTFIDFGSGKGRVVLMALEYGFKKIVGIEYSLPLHDAAVKNLKVFRAGRAETSSVELFCLDASHFVEFRRGNKLVCLYNPFCEHITEVVLNNLRHSAQLIITISDYLRHLHPGAHVWL